jgi:hypothetical protein
LKAADFRYVDFRVTAVSAKNLADPVKPGGKGITRSKMDASTDLPDEASPSDIAWLNLSITLDGFLGDSTEEKDKSFTVTVECRHQFKAAEKGWLRDDEAHAATGLLILQAYPLQLGKVRQIVHEMGFTGANPDLGVQLARLEPPASDRLEAKRPAARSSGKRKRSS